MTNTTFEEALNAFVEKFQASHDAYMEHNFSTLPRPQIELQRGKRYIRLVMDHSATGFIDTTTGDVLKAAGWKVPAKGVRGNIFSERGGMEALMPQGQAIRYLK